MKPGDGSTHDAKDHRQNAARKSSAAKRTGRASSMSKLAGANEAKVALRRSVSAAARDDGADGGGGGEGGGGEADNDGDDFGLYGLAGVGGELAGSRGSGLGGGLSAARQPIGSAAVRGGGSAVIGGGGEAHTPVACWRVPTEACG